MRTLRIKTKRLAPVSHVAFSSIETVVYSHEMSALTCLLSMGVTFLIVYIMAKALEPKD